jgi:hypothetical protein
MKSKPQEKPPAPEREHKAFPTSEPPPTIVTFFYIALFRIHASLNADPDPVFHLNAHPDQKTFLKS